MQRNKPLKNGKLSRRRVGDGLKATDPALCRGWRISGHRLEMKPTKLRRQRRQTHDPISDVPWQVKMLDPGQVPWRLLKGTACVVLPFGKYCQQRPCPFLASQIKTAFPNDYS